MEYIRQKTEKKTTNLVGICGVGGWFPFTHQGVIKFKIIQVNYFIVIEITDGITLFFFFIITKMFFITQVSFE